jgi:predicted enzyme related to lactoylglutathione lyase
MPTKAKAKATPKQKSRVNYADKPSSTDKPSSATKQPARDTIGWVTHTDIISEDPVATQKWAEKVLGWKFGEPRVMEGGTYRMFHYSDMGGGGIQKNMKDQAPGTTPFVHVKDCREAFDKAIAAGAEPLHEPTEMEIVVIATVKAPGGVVIGLSSEMEQDADN